jgi:hypothetical protein
MKPGGSPEERASQVTYLPGSTICGHFIEQHDVQRSIRFDQQIEVHLTKDEYLIFSLLIEHYKQEKREVSYADIATMVFACAFDDELLLVIRKRISSLRRKIARFDLDVMNMPQRGYELRSLRDIAWPYRRGYRARMRRH